MEAAEQTGSVQPLPNSQGQTVTLRQLSTELQQGWIERLFSRLAALYGASFGRQWEGTNLADVKAVWAEKLGGFTAQHIGAALKSCDDRPYPPNLPEFIELCRQHARGANQQRMPPAELAPDAVEVPAAEPVVAHVDAPTPDAVQVPVDDPAAAQVEEPAPAQVLVPELDPAEAAVDAPTPLTVQVPADEPSEADPPPPPMPTPGISSARVIGHPYPIQLLNWSMAALTAAWLSLSRKLPTTLLSWSNTV
jgi:hypothetical protein